MKNLDFLAKIKKLGKIESIEPSEEIKESYIEKSNSNMISAKILLDNNRLEEAVSLAYYSMYHNLTALLFKIGIKSENHSVSIILLKEIFNINNSDILFAKKERIDKQYYIDFHVTKKDIIEMIKIAEKFNKNMLNFIANLNTENIKIYNKRFKDMMKKLG